MYRQLKSLTVLSLCSFLLLSPVLISGNTGTHANDISAGKTKTARSSDKAKTAETRKDLMAMESHIIYDSLKLKNIGLNKKAFEYAWLGFQNLLETGKIKNTEVISICDFSQSSCKKRLYIIDIEEMKVLMNTYVAHGRNSGGEFARSFSNDPKSHKSSLGFYITGKTYYGGHGLALKIAGVERGINDKADARNIVIHGSEYVGDSFLRENLFNGRSFGCPAVPAPLTTEIINTIKNGSCLFIYHPSKQYLSKSKILNG